jgi:predicted enzyme related to lactoylglutathione lyase
LVTRDAPWPSGTPCWIDLGVKDIGAARAFYGSLFGWDIQPGPPEAGGYAMCLKDGRPVAGIGPGPGAADAPASWTTYIAADSADETAARIRAAGGQLLMEPMDVMDVGRMAMAADPAGAVFGLWQSRTHTGAGLVNEPDTLCWNENMSRDFDGNKAFYHAVFGYDYDDMSAEGFSYATLKLGDQIVGGIGGLGGNIPAATPAHWSTYFAVADTDAALATVAGLGGSVVQPAWDSPYGRMAVVSDDQGAPFSIMGLAAAEG